MDTVTEVVDIWAPAESVFAYVDDIRNVGWHMTYARGKIDKQEFETRKRDLQL